MIPSIRHPDVVAATAPALRATAAADLPFAEHLSGARGGSIRPEALTATTDRTEIARSAAEQFVAAAFLEPMLAQVRETGMGAGVFAPNAAERRFGPLLDQRIAHNVVRGAHFPLVDRIEAQILGESASGKVPHEA